MRFVNGPNTKYLEILDRTYLNFAGSSYLDLANNAKMKSAAISAVNKYGFANDLGYETAGHPIIELECAAARFFKTEASLYCASAYIAGGVAVEYFAKSADVVLLDENAHYTLAHAAHNSQLPIIVFKHACPDSLDKSLRAALRPGQIPLLLTDGVFPTWGTLAPLPAYVEILREYDGLIIVDDAHATGVLGTSGRGTLEHFSIEANASIILTASFSKALGSQGGIIAATSELIHTLRRTSKIYNAISLPTMPTAAAAVVSLSIASNPSLRQALWRNAAHLRSGIEALGFSCPASLIPIASFTTGSIEKNREIHGHLEREGFWVTLSNYVGAGDDLVLRNVVFSSHSPQEIDSLLDTYRRYI